MTIRVSGKNISIGEALQDRVKTRIDEVVAKYFDGGFSGHVTIGKDGFGFKTECVLHLASGIVLEADAFAADAYASADNTLAVMEKRLRRYKSRLRDRHSRKADNGNGFAAPSYVIEPPAETEADDEVAASAYSPVTIAESTTNLRRLSVSEAVMELDMTGAPVLCFQHDGSGRVNVIYRRSDGNIGWIDPPAVAAQQGH
jgi:ribosomal subunit interface protein